MKKTFHFVFQAFFFEPALPPPLPVPSAATATKAAAAFRFPSTPISPSSFFRACFVPYSIPYRTSVASSTRSGASKTASGQGRTPGLDAAAEATTAMSELERASVGRRNFPERAPFKIDLAVDSGSESGGERAAERRWAAGDWKIFCVFFHSLWVSQGSNGRSKK